MLQVFPVPAFEDNYLWVLHNDRHAAVVDPGDATPVIDYLSRHDLILDAVLVTHHHADHVGGIGALLEWFGSSARPTVYGPATENIPHREVSVMESSLVSLPNLGITLDVMDVPGHTAGHVAYFARQQRWLFSGDTIFAAGCGRLLGGTAAQLHASLSRISELPAETKIYCTHEYTLSNIRFARAADPTNAALAARADDEQDRRHRNEPTLPTSVAIERATNPFLRCDTDTVRETVAMHASNPGLRANSGAGAPPVEVFAALREWKNNFK